MKTIKLYQQDVYIKEWNAVITSVEAAGDDKYNITLDQTAFFPEGGGQSCDIGTLTIPAKKKKDSDIVIEVIDVQETDDGGVVHTVVTDAKLSDGIEVVCQLDWDRRFDNMQRHCGEHILSGIFYAQCGGVNRGFHMGEEYMTIDISLEDEPTDPDAVKPKEITYELAMKCELLANKVIWSNAPVTVMRFETRDEVKGLPLRKALAFDEDISIVCVGDPKNAADCVACCGTHPATAGQVGLIKIYKVEKYKNMFRIYFESGQRALKNADMKHTMLMELSNRYSCAIEDFPVKLKANEERLSIAKRDLHHFKSLFLNQQKEVLNKLLAGGEADGIDGIITTDKLVVLPIEDITTDDAFNMAKEYMGKAGKLVMLYAVADTSYVLVSDGKINCGQLVKEYASFYNGKGGGRDIQARAIFTTDDDAKMFADLIAKHLR